MTPKTHSDTPGMACYALAQEDRGWIGSSARSLQGDTVLVRNGRGKLLSFLNCLFYFGGYSSVSPIGCLNRPRVCSKHISDCTRNWTGWLAAHKKQFGGWSGCGKTWPPPLSDLLIRTTPAAQNRAPVVPVVSKNGSIWPSGNIIEVQAWMVGWKQQPWRRLRGAAESVQTWGDSRQLQS